MTVSKNSFLNSRKPFKLLALFSEAELAAFHDFLRFPHRDTPKKAAQKVLDYYERALAVKVATQAVTKAEFIKGTSLPASPNAFDKLTSIFYDRMQEFLAFQELKADPVTQQQLAFRAYQHRPFEWKEIRRRHKEAERELDKLPQSSQLANAKWSLKMDLATTANTRSISPSERGYTDLLASLEANYVTQKLRLLCAIANDRRIFASSAEALPPASALPPLSPTWPDLARMYYLVYLVLIGEESETSVAALDQLLAAQQADSPVYPRADMMDLYGYLLNAVTQEVNRGDQAALQRLSNLHDHLIAQGILLKGAEISAEHFKNVISVKLKTGEIAAARAHFEQFRTKIFNDPDQNAVRYNHALLLYAEQQLPAAAQELEQLCGQTGNLKLDQFYGLDLRGNLLKVYFDLLVSPQTSPQLWDEADEKMVRLLESFKGYIERRKLPEHRRKNYDNFRRLMQMVYNFAFSAEIPDPSDYQKIEAQVEQSGVAVKGWFVERMEKIKNQRHS